MIEKKTKLIQNNVTFTVAVINISACMKYRFLRASDEANAPILGIICEFLRVYSLFKLKCVSLCVRDEVGLKVLA